MERLAKAHVQGPQDEPLLTVTIPQMLRDTVARHGGRDALVVRHQNVRWSYYDLARAVDDLAAGLLALGLEPGDRIGIWSPNRYEWVVTQFATARVGLVLVNINPAYRLAEVDYALNKVAAKALI
ncbi:MAG: AMP-binding protein, partial [Ferrovibrionaceae bacterium]